ncbi:MULTISPECIES: flagellar biosynthesis protein FlhF [Clostridium]|uniref:Flagellar biosynthesis protein FlhF n=1 Tax=Clostridium cibarium TaxID=2762247 RepID=A0ABR8PNS1_9CLOT|nr:MULTISPECIES: flagellar biosynthesis protein FlhF [Clostridium]MBD7909829.1 flagellar biosynthesis protein FlhF [Clostridium cibarium]
MVIKKYTANNMNEALTRIRHELGKEAVIISQRKIKRPGIKGFFSSKLIEVTAAIENSTLGSSKKAEEKQSDDLFKESLHNFKRVMSKEIGTKKETEPAENNQLQAEVAEMKELLNKVIKNTDKGEAPEDELLTLIKDIDIDVQFYEELKTKVGDEDISDKFRKVIEDEIEISKDELSGNVVFVGPTGVGKTTTIAKLAGKLSLIDKKKVGLITVDTYRIGAVEQLKTYAEIMNIPFKVVITMKEMEEAVESMKDCDIVLIDTTGRSSKNTMQISELRAFVQKANPDSVNLVISATTKNRDIKTILEGYKELEYKSVIITKLDETSVYGCIYNIRKISKQPLRFITTGQNVPDDIKAPTKSDIIRFIFGEEALC